MAYDILVKVGADISDFSAKMSQSQKALSDFNSKNKETFDSFKKVGGAVTAAGATIAAGLGVAAKHAIDFESSFAGVRKTVDASEAEFAELEKGIRNMSKELPASVHEINGVAEAAGQLGIEKENILDFTRTMIDLGEATNLTSDQAATSFARFANIVGMPQDNFDKLGSSVVELGNNLATTEAEIVEMSMRLAGVGNQVGMTEAEIMALAGAMSSVGIEAEAGGTAMSTVLKKMQNAVSSGGKDLESFAKAAGMSSKEFATAFEKDPISALDAFIKNLAKSGEEGKNLNEILDSVGIKGIREADTILRLAGASDLLSEAVGMSTKAWDENTALSDEAEQRYKTLASQLGILKNTLIDAGISIGQALMPAIQKVTDIIKGLTERFNGLSDGTKRFIAIGAAVVSALMLIVGPILMLIGFIPQIVMGFGAVMTVIKAVGAAMAILTSPVALVIAAIVGLAFLIYKYWDEIKAFTIAAWGAIRDFFSELWTSIKETATTAWEGIKTFFSELWASITEMASTAWNAFITAIMTIVQPFIEQVMNVFNGMKDGLQTMWDGIKQYFSGVWELIKNIFLGALLLIYNLVTGNFEELRSNAKAIWENIKDALKNIWEGIKKVFSGALSAIWGGVKSAWDNIKTNTQTAFNTAKSTITTIWGAIKTFFTDTLAKIWQTVRDKFNDVVNSARDKMNEAKQKVEDAWNKAVDFLKSIDLLQIGKDVIQGFIDGIKSKVTAVADAAKEAADAVTGKIKSILGIKSPSRVMRDQVGVHIGTGLAAGIKKSTGAVTKAAQAQAQAALKAQQSTVQKINNQVMSASNTYASKIMSLNKKLTNDIKKANAEYDKALADRTKSIANQIGLFDKFEAKAVSRTDLIGNLRGQVQAMRDFSGNLAKIGKNAPKAFVDELREMGLDSASEISAIAGMSKKELDEYVKLWKQKQKAAGTEAAKQLEGLKTQTTKKINELRVAASNELNVLRGQYVQKLRTLAADVKKLGSFKNSGKVLGKNAVAGIINGLGSMKGELAAAAKRIANTITKTVKSTLKIKSPSRVMIALAKFVPLGIAKGMDSTVGTVRKASEQLTKAMTPEAPKVSMAYATPSGTYDSLAQAVNGSVDVNTRDSMLAGAIDDLRRDLTNLRVEMDKREVGRIVAPTVGQELNDQVSQTIRGRGRRRI